MPSIEDILKDINNKGEETEDKDAPEGENQNSEGENQNSEGEDRTTEDTPPVDVEDVCTEDIINTHKRMY